MLQMLQMMIAGNLAVIEIWKQAKGGYMTLKDSFGFINLRSDTRGYIVLLTYGLLLYVKLY